MPISHALFLSPPTTVEVCIAMEPRQPDAAPSTAGRVSEHQTLGALADQLNEAGLEATLDRGPAFPVVFIAVPGSRGLREMVLVSGGEFVWEGGHCRVDDVPAAAAVLARHVHDLAERLIECGVAPPSGDVLP